MTRISERVKIVNELNIQLKHGDNLLLPLVFGKKNERHWSYIKPDIYLLAQGTSG